MEAYERTLLRQFGISADLTQHALDISDQGRINPSPIQVSGIPESQDPRIVDIGGSAFEHSFDFDQIMAKLSGYGLAEVKAIGLLAACGIARPESRANVLCGCQQLSKLGVFLVPLVSLGILNGGSATSYFDLKKNQEFSPWLFSNFSALIEIMAERWAKLPKALSPAFLDNPTQSSDSFSFLHLKLRAWLLQIRQYQVAKESLGFDLPWDGLEMQFPVFQMDSQASHSALREEFAKTQNSPLLSQIAKQCGISLIDPLTATQEMMAAFTRPLADGSRKIFTAAYGRENCLLALPGGHGQNFHVLKDIYRQLRTSGKKLAYLGNIDNLGFVPDPLCIALTTLSDCQASFEFAHKTSMDRKGGILVQTGLNRLTCGDIGQAVSPEFVDEAEKAHKKILFNCATGLFNLDYLCPNLEDISRKLPLRFSNQEKDAGSYSQAEQTSWEVIGLLDSPLIIGVQKQERFLAAKLFLDCIITSGLANELRATTAQDQEILQIGNFLHQGLRGLLLTRYGLRMKDGKWQIQD